MVADNPSRAAVGIIAIWRVDDLTESISDTQDVNLNINERMSKSATEIVLQKPAESQVIQKRSTSEFRNSDREIIENSGGLNYKHHVSHADHLKERQYQVLGIKP